MDRITDTHIFFWSGEFSNWCPCKFKHKGITFFNSEQAFMWEKAIYFHDSESAQDIIKYGHDPQVAKSIGRTVKNFKAHEWLEQGYTVMVDVNYEKYTQNPHLKLLLRESYPKILVEASPTDSIWGIGLHWSDDKVLNENNWKGLNLLGKALMEVREKLIEEYGTISE